MKAELDELTQRLEMYRDTYDTYTKNREGKIMTRRDDIQKLYDAADAKVGNAIKFQAELWKRRTDDVNKLLSEVKTDVMRLYGCHCGEARSTMTCGLRSVSLFQRQVSHYIRLAG
ncbi:hypothetical protein PRIC1_006611 [Phytophthora ramorum]